MDLWQKSHGIASDLLPGGSYLLPQLSYTVPSVHFRHRLHDIYSPLPAVPALQNAPEFDLQHLQWILPYLPVFHPDQKYKLYTFLSSSFQPNLSLLCFIRFFQTTFSDFLHYTSCHRLMQAETHYCSLRSQ